MMKFKFDEFMIIKVEDEIASLTWRNRYSKLGRFRSVYKVAWNVSAPVGICSKALEWLQEQLIRGVVVVDEDGCYLLLGGRKVAELAAKKGVVRLHPGLFRNNMAVCREALPLV